MKEYIIILIAFCIGAFVAFIPRTAIVKSSLEVDITRQRNIYSFKEDIYYKGDKLSPCLEKDKKICRFSCAPEGVCIFIPTIESE